MEETPEQETARLLAPYYAARDAAAHAVLDALLTGAHRHAIDLLNDYQLLVLAAQSAETVCGWFDDGTAAEHIEIHDMPDLGNTP